MVRRHTGGMHQIWYESGEENMKRSLNTAICLCCADWDQQGNIKKQKLESTKENLLLIEKFLHSDRNG